MTGALHRTARLQALDHDFAVETSSPELTAYLDRIYRALAVDGEPERVYTVVDHGLQARKRFSVALDGEVLRWTNRKLRVLAFLVWHINQLAVQTTTGLVLLHAAAAERDGRALILPASMESGKSTLVAGLVRAGMRYVTDEAVALDPLTSIVAPFPRPISLDQGSWEVLPDLRPEVPPDVAPYLRDQWHVDVLGIRAGSVAAECTSAFVVTPRYERGATTQLEPMSRGEAVMVMAQNCFNLADLGTVAFTTLVDVARSSDCYRLTIGDLDEACELVLDVVGARAATDRSNPYAT